jgi:hypothetical protein
MMGNNSADRSRYNSDAKLRPMIYNDDIDIEFILASELANDFTCIIRSAVMTHITDNYKIKMKEFLNASLVHYHDHEGPSGKNHTLKFDPKSLQCLLSGGDIKVRCLGANAFRKMEHTYEQQVSTPSAEILARTLQEGHDHQRFQTNPR